MTENEVLARIKNRFTEELKTFIGEGNLLDVLSAFLGGFQNAVSLNMEINSIDHRNHLELLEFVQENEERLKDHFNKKLGLQGLFLIYEKAYHLLKENSERNAQEVISGVYGIVKNSELGKNLNGIIDDNKQLSLLNTLANPKGESVFATEEEFEKKILVNIRNLLNRNTTLNDSNKELALTQYVMDLYSSIHGAKIKNENLVSLLTYRLPQHITSYISNLSKVLHTFPFPTTEENISTELRKSYTQYSSNAYPILLQEQKFVEAFECLLIHHNTDNFEKTLISPENMHCNFEGSTALHFVAWLGYVDIVNDLIKNGKNINAANEHRNTPLHYAAQNGYEDVVRVLIKKGANVNAVGELGWTPLHRAAQNGHTDVAKILIQKALTQDFNAQKPDYLTDVLSDYWNKCKNEIVKKVNDSNVLTTSIIAGCSTAVLGAVIAVALLATGTVVAGLIPIIGAVAIVVAVALAVGGITYGLLKPSTEVNKAKKENVNGNVPKVCTTP